MYLEMRQSHLIFQARKGKAHTLIKAIYLTVGKYKHFLVVSIGCSLK